MFGVVSSIYVLNGVCTKHPQKVAITVIFGADMEKVASMKAMLVQNFSENSGHFQLNNNFLAIFTHQCPQVCIITHN